MDPFEQRLKSIPLRRPSARFGRAETLREVLRGQVPRQGFIERINNMSWKSKAMAVAGFAASVALAFVVLTGTPTASTAFAQVAERFRAAQTLSFDWAEERISDGKILGRGRTLYATPGKVRVEMDAEGVGRAYFVADMPTGKVMFVDLTEKTASLVPLSRLKEKDMAAAAIEDLRTLAERATQTLEKKQVDGVEANGFVVDGEHCTTTVWADAASGNPIRVEVRSKVEAQDPVKTIWTKIALDLPLDRRLFSVTPPAGFRTKQLKPADAQSTRATYVAEFLKIYAKHMNGEFPSRLEDAPERLKESFQSSPERQPPLAELLPLPMYVAAMHSMTRKGVQGVDWQYYPGHKMGEADHLLFWVREPRGEYFGVYGDLRVEKVAKEGLPVGPPDN